MKDAFDLEAAFAAWRRHLKHRRVFMKEDADELERHLRDHVAHLTAAGHSPRKAFRVAVQMLGDFNTAETEYRKVYWGKLRRKGRRLHELIWHLAMLKNYVTITLRHLRKQAGYAGINLAGLAIGLAGCLLIFLFVQDELSFDRFHEKVERIYRLEREVYRPGSQGRFSFTAGPHGPTLVDEVPTVEAATRTFKLEVLARHKDRQFFGEQVSFVDPGFLDIFSFPLLQGNPETALAAPYSIVLTASMAERFFGDTNPLGQTLTLDNEADYTVTGVMADVPHNSHYSFDALASFGTLLPTFTWLENWSSIGVQTYVLLTPGTTAREAETAFRAVVTKHVGADAQEAFRLRPLTRIHLHSDVYELQPQGSIETVYLFAAIALFIVLLACINYMNLATARAARRMQEVGIRKVMGAHRMQLVGQFLGESVLLTVTALLLALGLARLVLPWLNTLLDRSLSLSGVMSPLLVGSMAGGVLLVSLLAGFYPALYLSRFEPTKVLKGTLPFSAAGFRKTLVVMQFAVSIAMLICTAIVYQQLQFLQTQDLGFDKENVVNIYVRDEALLDDVAAMQERLQNDPHVINASISSSGVKPSSRSSVVAPVAADDTNSGHMTDFVFGDPEYIPTMGIKLVAGRNFSEERASESSFDVIINETGAERYGFSSPEEAIGQRLQSGAFGADATVIGVVEDFHISSLRTNVRPLILIDHRLEDDAVLAVRLRPGDASNALSRFERLWETTAPEWPFEFAFLDNELDQQYRSEQRIGRLVGIFTGLAVLIACLGLFGLAAYSAERRTKEIGVRKVLGASLGNLILLLSKDFIRLVAIAFVIAVPLVYAGMDRWLDDFAYRIEISWRIFLIAGLTALGVAWLTVSYQAIKAALADPVKSLRHE